MSVEVNRIEWANALLIGIAHKIQLNKTDHDKAVNRYNIISQYLTGIHTDVLGASPVIYPQGSFRTRSTISSYRNDDYDIDLILELNMSWDQNPNFVMDFLYEVMEQGKGRLQFESVEKKRRCVTLNYTGMHLDITPAVFVDPSNIRLVSIFDTHPDRPNHALANPEGFARWFDERVLSSESLRKFSIQARTFPVPDQEPLEEKPLRLLSLQLLKRFRDIASDVGKYERCPSVLLSKLVALAPSASTGGLVGDLTVVTRFVRDQLNVELPYEENPTCSRDVFTDRWPENTKAHLKFVTDLNRLLEAIQRLAADGTLVEKQSLLQSLFGERAAQSVFADVQRGLAEKSRSGALSTATVSGAISIPTSNAAAKSSIPIKPHRFFGR